MGVQQGTRLPAAGGRCHRDDAGPGHSDDVYVRAGYQHEHGNDPRRSISGQFVGIVCNHSGCFVRFDEDNIWVQDMQ